MLLPGSFGGAILGVAALGYTLKTIGLLAISGASMACSDGGTCGPALAELLFSLRFGLAYLIGGIAYATLKNRGSNTATIEKYLEALAVAHLFWIVFVYIIYMGLIAPLAPKLLSYWASPGARTLRFIDFYVAPAMFAALMLWGALRQRL